MTDDAVRTGGCLCGAVRFEARGTPQNVLVCHCRLCQKAMAGPFFARALYAGPRVTVTGEVSSYPTTELDRLFCPKCGTRIGAYRKLSDNMALALALFDDPNDLPPAGHFFTDFKIGWVATGELPTYGEWAPD